MTVYYLDASALSKRYVAETGTPWVRSLITTHPANTVLAARISMVEVVSALARRKREGSVPATECAIAAQGFAEHCARDQYSFIELDMEVVKLAQTLLDKYPLRAYDAVQLASSLKANGILRAARQSGPIFVSADDRLNAVAAAEGLAVDNPNNHP